MRVGQEVVLSSAKVSARCTQKGNTSPENLKSKIKYNSSLPFPALHSEQFEGS